MSSGNRPREQKGARKTGLLEYLEATGAAGQRTMSGSLNFRRLELLHASGNQPLAMRDAAEYARRFCPVELMPIFLFWLRSRYGDIVSYLTRIGISGAEVAALRHALTTAA